MHHMVSAAIMFAEFMNLGMAVMTSGNAIIRFCGLNLFILEPAVGEALLFKSGLQKPAAAAAAVIIGAVGLHVDEIFFSDDGLHNESQVFGNGVAETLSNDLTGILDGELDLEVFVPVGIDLELALPDPFGIIFINVLNFAFVRDVELFQSCQD